MKFRPCIDLHNGKVKQIVGSTLSSNSKELVENFVADKPASYFAKLYKKDSLTGGHIILLDDSKETKKQAIEALKEYPKGMQIGGGVNNENAKYWIDLGASKVILTSYIFSEGKINFDDLEKVIQKGGKENIVLDLSCRKKGEEYFVVTDKWQKFTSFSLTECNIKLLEEKCSEFLVHAVDVEGKQSGIQEELVKKLANCVNIPCIYAGGIRNLSDLELVKKTGKGKIDATIGSALNIFGGKLDYKEVIDWNKKQRVK